MSPSMIGCLLAKGIRTLVGDLEDRPQHLVLFLAFVRGVFGILHLVRELEEGVFDVVEALGRRLAVARGAEGRHGGGGVLLLVLGGEDNFVLPCSGGGISSRCKQLPAASNFKHVTTLAARLLFPRPAALALLTATAIPAANSDVEQHTASDFEDGYRRHWRAGHTHTHTTAQ